MSILPFSCSMDLQPSSAAACQREMVQLLKEAHHQGYNPRNTFRPDAKLPFMDSLLSNPHSSEGEIRFCTYLKANILLELGEEKKAIRLLEPLVKSRYRNDTQILKTLALAYLRLGERSNCVSNHASESCILPISGLGIHNDMDGSRKAIESYQALLRVDPSDLESRWLLNLAYMTIGDYPEKVPADLLIPGMQGDTTHRVRPFEDIAGDLKLEVGNMAGGSITDDFDNDGYVDVITSGWGTSDAMHYFHNSGDGKFEDWSQKMQLKGITGGLNLLQTDYNNDGYKDIFVLRGAWRGAFGHDPNSLLRNNGDGTFTDVTTASGLLSFHPTQTATWNDFNNDGWLDVYIGNESVVGNFSEMHPNELYINNQDGTFREVAHKALCDLLGFVKGVTSGDYDNDGWQDIFISTMDGGRRLFRNKGVKDGEISFTDATVIAGLSNEKNRTFPTWFWDYDNDGWLDIFLCDYTFERSLGYYEAAEKLGIAAGADDKMLLYHNNGDGTFTNVSKKVGLTTNVFAMGANFGDIDNDGYLDMYLGSGNPLYQSLVPNKMFHNLGGKEFADVTTSARVGHLQKGHGVSFADMDNDGDEDIYIEMGGAYPGDSYQNSFFLNPGQNTNNWISIELEGKKSNRLAIGTRIKVSFRENGVVRHVFRDVNSGGSFGASPLRQHIGIGQASVIDAIEINWGGSHTIQKIQNVKPGQSVVIKEEGEMTTRQLKSIDWVLPNRLCIPGTFPVVATDSLARQ
ncbi:FG-GAP-like repeat-containing protein [Chryseolinea sp. T2]|uniref:FG-GAP-like repeat-containing protein n=1 Tax=Chryseolinea sp. T2 TaxID=3129255 RepID=UPI0030769E08